MPVFEFFPIQMKCGGGIFPRLAVPTVGQDDAADVPKQGGDFGQVDTPPVLWRKSSNQTLTMSQKFAVLQNSWVTVGPLSKMVSKISALPNKWAVRVGSQMPRQLGFSAKLQ